MGRVKTLRLAENRLFVSLFTLAYFVAFLLTAVTWLLPSAASAAELTVKSITISTSAASAQAEYSLTFTPATTSVGAGSLIVDFCANDPLISDTCTFSAATVPTVSSGITSSAGTAGVMGSGSPIHTISVTTISSGLAAGTPITFNFDATPSAHLTNPTTNVTFYARILVWPGNTSATSDYTPANTSGTTPTVSGSPDTGGIALSTAASIGITAVVYETLTFCVFTTACGTTPNLILGNTTTGALSTSAAYVNSNTQYTIASNADTSVGVTMSGTTLCRSSGATNCQPGGGGYSANTITPIGNTAAAAYPGGVGTSQFGMCVDTNGATNLVAVAPYLDAINNCNSGLATGTYTGSSKFGFNDSTSNGTNSAGGDQIMSSSSSGVIPNYTGTLSFVGNIAATTSSGIYTTSLNLVATGTF